MTMQGAMRRNAKSMAFAIFAVTAMVAMANQDAHALPLTVSGLISNPGDYTIAELQALGSEVVTVGNGGTADTYTGVSLWSLLGGQSNGASNVITQGGGNNPILRNYISATGADGSRSLISLGEINPSFGGTGSPYVVAYEKNGVVLDTPELIVPRDSTGMRNVIDLTGIDVASAPRPPVGAGGPSTAFTVSGPSGTVATVGLADLMDGPSRTEDVSFVSGSNPPQPHSYTGVPLWSLLSDLGLTSDAMNAVLLATGSDGFQVLFTLAELSPLLGAPAFPDPEYLVAYADFGELLTTSGFARLAIPGDFRGGRYVSNLVSLEVVDVPEPAAVTLLLVALAGLAIVRRRKRSSTVLARRAGFAAAAI
jgi:hypothetical protein